MKKLILIPSLFILLSSLALADYDMMGEYGMMGYGMMGGYGGMFLGGLWSLIYLALASFIFSAVFWWTYKKMVKEKKR